MGEVEVGVWVYVAAVLVAGLATIVRGLWWLRSNARRRLQNAVRTVRFEAVRTSMPADDPSRTRDRATEAIEQQFTVTRRLFVPGVLIATLCLALIPFLGSIPASLLSGVLAVISIVLGIALRPVVQNAVAGLVIGSSKLINIGDTVLFGEHYGVIEDITITHTAVKLWDWRRWVIPNQEMLETAFINYTIIDRFIWAWVEFWVAPDADLARVKELAIESARRSDANTQAEEPRFWVIGMDKDSIRCWVAAWTANPADAWTLGSDVRTSLSLALQQEGIRTQLGQLELSHREAVAPPVAASRDHARSA